MLRPGLYLGANLAILVVLSISFRLIARPRGAVERWLVDARA